ncbi:enoyl-CoA hydratase/isomerase family protein [Streptomyces sp. W16]|uniref:enoyl-CoA hydratase/isomerase family protein n=1 Tax=Streptomyces sp. W16 TaxID=3076631 RepID=UPI00295C21C5|nr:enoyl-CoA hydratase/isomerase family protein [Streptomyces sp. W16]MDV9169007.1 enoyl-CoA hydratase/isomerase family protein [Streptomyces sp. W16]
MTAPSLELTQFTVRETAPGYWRITFDHPPANLMTAVTAAELRTIVEAAETASDLRVMVFDSANEQFFFARYDVSQGPLPADPGPTGLPIFLDTTVRLGALPAISIAQIAGRARGGGNELALSCDLRYAALESAVFGQPEIGSALVPAGGGLERLVSLVGRSRTLEIAATGNDYDAATAELYGWITRAVPAADLPGFVDALARRIAGFDGAALAEIKRLVGRTTLTDPAALLDSSETATRLTGGPGFRPALERVRARARAVGADFDLRMGFHIGTADEDRAPRR